MNQPSGSQKRSSSQTELPMDERSAKRTQKTTLESVHDDLDDAAHARQDEEVLKTIGDWTMGDDPIDPIYATMLATMLLATIVSSSEQRLNPQYEKNPNAKALLQEHPELADKLKVAWVAKKFKEIRNLEILHPPTDTEVFPAAIESSVSARRSRRLNSDFTRKVVQGAWDESYAGQCDDLLLQSINAMDRTKLYSNTVSIVQSSGTGKSRMVHELAKLVFTIPFNLRAASEDKDFAWPPPDKGIREHLVNAPTSNVHVAEQCYLTFLTSLFMTTCAELASFTPGKRSSPQALALEWREHLTDKRDDLYRRVILKAVTLGSSKENEVDPDPNVPRHPTPPVVRSSEEVAVRALKDLLEKIDSLTTPENTGNVRVVVYFDEAHALSVDLPGDEDGKQLYDVMSSCFNRFVSYPLVGLYLSTNSHLAQLAPSHRMARSARARSSSGFLQAPITELPFDCAPDLLIKPRELSLSDLGEIEFMSKFGRPMFWSLLKAADREGRKGEFISELIPTARAKLLLTNNINMNYRDLTPAARLAVLDVRLMLDFEPRREAARTLEAQLVASHMRLAYSVPESREYVRSGYSSEPILAEAAAVQMQEFRRQNSPAILEILSDNVKGGLLDPGERGELVARELLTSAYDRAIEKEQSTPHTRNYSAGVSLITFIEELFPKEIAQDILNSVPDNVLSQTELRDAYKDAKVRFTHWGKMKDELGTTTYAAWAAFVRGMAIISRSGDLALDFMLPILLFDAKLCEEVMSGLLIQIKRRKKKGTTQEYQIDERSIGFFPAPAKTSAESPQDAPIHSPAERPYISLVLELGIQAPLSPEAKINASLATSQRKSKAKKNKSKQNAKSTPSKPSTRQNTRQNAPLHRVHVVQRGQLHHTTANHPRYNIFVYGCSPAVYKGVCPREQSIYDFLLASRDILDEHPRPHALSAVRRMKPFWSAGIPSYHWIQEDVLCLSEGSAPDAWVTVGKAKSVGDGGKSMSNWEADGNEDSDMTNEGEQDESKADKVLPSIPEAYPAGNTKDLGPAPSIYHDSKGKADAKSSDSPGADFGQLTLASAASSSTKDREGEARSRRQIRTGKKRARKSDE